MGTVRVGEVEVAYGKDGSGDPVVLVHGTTSSRDSWILQTPVLAERFTVICPEYSGSGQTVDPTDKPLEVADLAEQCLAAAADAGAERFHVAGWSLGAVVAVEMAARAPDRVRSLVPVNGWVKTDNRMRWTFDLWQRMIETSPDLFARYAFADGLTLASFQAFGTEGVEALVADTAAAFAPGSIRQMELDKWVDITDRLALVQAPTLVIGGIEDRWVDIIHSREMAEGIKGARLVELQCGHLVPTEQADELTRLLSEHFDAN
jgi:3-oxoadipate enol-lactonase